MNLKKLIRITALLVFSILITANVTKADDSFDSLLANRNALLRAGTPSYFDGDDYDNRTRDPDYYLSRSKAWRDLNDLDDTPGLSPDDKYAKRINTTDSSDTTYIPRQYNVLTFKAPENFNTYNPNNPSDKANIYRHLHNLTYLDRSYSWVAAVPYPKGFVITDHSKPASFIIKNVAYYDGSWIDMVYTITLAGKNGPDGRDDWTTYKFDPSLPMNSSNVYINIGPNIENWLNVSVHSGGVYPRNYPTARNGTIEASRWVTDIRFVRSGSTEADPDPDETDETKYPAVQASGTYQIFNDNFRKIIAIDKKDLLNNGNKVWSIDSGSTLATTTNIRGRVNSHNSDEVEFWSTNGSNDATNTNNAFLYLFNKGKVHFTVVRSNAVDLYGIYVGTSNNPIVRAEVPYADMDTTTNDLGVIKDSSGTPITASATSNIIYTPQTVQFDVLQQFPVQPPSKSVAPTNFDVKGFRVPKYASIDLDSIDVKSIKGDSIDAILTNQYQSLTKTNDSKYPNDDVYNYSLDTSSLVGRVFKGIENKFIRAGLNFKIDWDAKDSNGDYLWKSGTITTSTSNGKRYLVVPASVDSIDVYRRDGNGNKIYETSTTTDANSGNLKSAYYSKVQIPQGKYEFNYQTTSNATIPGKTTTTVAHEIGQNYDISDQVNKYITDSNHKDYEFDHAVVDGKTINTFKDLQKELKSIPYTYNNNTAKKIDLYYNPAVSRVTFHYWDLNDAGTKPPVKVDPVNYYQSTPTPTNLPTDIFTLAASSTNANYTIGEWNKSVEEELPSGTSIVDQYNPTPSDKDAPAPAIKDHRFLGYYQYTVGATTADFHPYNDKEKDKTKNNAWANINYTQDNNQVIVFVYSSLDSRVLTVGSNIDFGKGTTVDTNRVNKDEFNLSLVDNFAYADPTMTWPTRNWVLSVSAANIKNERGTFAPLGSTIKFDDPKDYYAFKVNGNAITSVNDSKVTNAKKDFNSYYNTINLDNKPHTLLKVADLQDSSNTGLTGPLSKEESLTFTWAPAKLHLKVPSDISGGHYETTLNWTLTNSLN
ncbi:hypothetical protein [Bombilactobacillus bombi]|uniref:hypothetical protein n=1 Tax=Bombilactobacillus bombi TaxID=1303590 RepID=UPI0015E62751|nr:hypothetical protein [Bombilactobacillus bombi]MBA1434478.1 hypothetical protein [Bombilactobacillus bombi]